MRQLSLGERPCPILYKALLYFSNLSSESHIIFWAMYPVQMEFALEIRLKMFGLYMLIS